MKKQDPLLPLGVGVGIGAALVWALVELWPIIIITGGVYVALKSTTEKSKE